MGNLIADIIDPLTNEMRYVGKTRCGLSEPRGYVLASRKMNEMGRDGRRHVHRWICSLLRNGLEPKIEIIQFCKEDELNDLEISWISFFRELGCRLTNMTDGGDGGRRTKSLDERMKISRAHAGRKHSKIHRERHAESLRGKKMLATTGSNHWTAKQHRGPNKGKKFSEEHRQKLSNSHLGQIPWNKGK